MAENALAVEDKPSRRTDGGSDELGFDKVCSYIDFAQGIPRLIPTHLPTTKS
jgi:hypothetical protein